MSKSLHIFPKDNGWGVRATGALRVTSVHETQAAAISAASSLLKKSCGEIIVHGRNGAIKKRRLVGIVCDEAKRVSTLPILTVNEAEEQAKVNRDVLEGVSDGKLHSSVLGKNLVEEFNCTADRLSDKRSRVQSETYKFGISRDSSLASLASKNLSPPTGERLRNLAGSILTQAKIAGQSGSKSLKTKSK